MKPPSFLKPLLCILLLGAALRAQAGAEASGEAAKKLGFTFSNEILLSSDTELKGGDSEYRHVSFTHAYWNLYHEFSITDTSTLSLGLDYNLSTYHVTDPSDWEDNDEWNAYKETHPDWKHIPVPKQLHSLSLSADYSRQLNARWSLSTHLSAGSHVAGKKLLANGWGLNTSIVGLYRYSETSTVAVGAAYDSLSSRYRLVPIIGLDWQINEKWSAAIGFPSTSVTYAMTSRLTMAVELAGAGGTYHVQEEPEGIHDRVLKGSKLETTEVRFGYRVTWRINDTYTIGATAGHVVYREFKYIDRDYRVKSRDVAGFAAINGSIAF